MSEHENPFSYTGLVDRRHAAPRRGLEAALERHFEGHENLLVQGPRRTGKTSLVVNTFKALEKQKACWLLELDLYGVQKRTRVEEKLSRAIGQLPLTSSIRVKVQRALGQLREFGVAGVRARWEGGQTALEDLMLVLNEIGKSRPVVVFLDEFQSLLEIPESEDILGSMRSVIQRQPDIFYLFAGSDQNRLREMFFVQKNPFLKSVAVLDVGPIPREAFIPWLEKQFQSGKRKPEAVIWGSLFDFVADIPGDVQQICHVLWEKSSPGETIGLPELKLALESIVSMQESSFRDVWSVLATYQRRLLVGLAKHPNKGHTSAEFRHLAGIDTGATASRAMTAMLQKGIIWRSGDQILFSNPFLRYWLLDQG